MGDTGEPSDPRPGPSAVDGLLERYLPNLVAYVRLHARDLPLHKESCADLVQSVCREVLASADGFEDRGEPAFRKWLFTKALSKIRDRHRYWLAEKRHAGHEQPLSHTSDGPPDVAGPASPSQVVIREEDMQLLERAFQELPEDYRRVITLARIVGLPHADVAAEMGRTEGATRVLLHRALTRLGWLMTQGDRSGGFGGE